MSVDRSGNALAVSKSNETSNKTSNPALNASGDANRSAQPTNSLVDEHEESKISSVRNSLLDDELDAVYVASDGAGWAKS